MNDHVFISYSHVRDTDYVESLATYLTGRGVPVFRCCCAAGRSFA